MELFQRAFNALLAADPVADLLTPALIGLVFMFAAIIQQTNTFYRRAKMSFVTSLWIGVCHIFQVIYVVKGQWLQVCAFQLGSAWGCYFGNKFGHKIQDFMGSSSN